MIRDKGKFTKGASGNPSGRGSMKLLTDQLRAELVQHPEKARNIARKLIDQAMEGDLQAATLLFNRIEGTPTQTIDVTTTTRSSDPAEVDQRIRELADRLRIGSIPPLIDLAASEVPGEDDQRH
jgi:hypothetical protein